MFKDLADLLNKTADEERAAMFPIALDNFGAILRFYPELRIYVEAASGMGHQASSVLVMKRLIQVFGYTRRIRIVYQAGNADTGPTVEKLAILIPNFDPQNPGADINVLGATVSALEWNNRGQLAPAAFGFTGGADIDTNLATELRVAYFLRLQPYFWLEAQRIERFGTDDGADLNELFGIDFYRRAYWYPPANLTANDWTWYKTHGTPTQQAHTALAQTLLDNLGAIHLCPVYGVRERSETGQLPDETLAQIAVAVQAAKRAGYTGPAVVVSLDDGILPASYDSLATILEGGLSRQEVQYQQAAAEAEEELKKPALPPDQRQQLQARVTATAGLLRNAALRKQFLKETGLGREIVLLPSATVSELTTALQTLRNDPDQVLVFQLGSVPALVYQTIFQRATLPQFFEGQGTANLALTLGLPYVHIPRPIGEEGFALNNYPSTTLQYPNASAAADVMADIARSVTAGFTNVDNSFRDSTAQLALFIRNVMGPADHPLKRYFASIRDFYSVESNDKLLVACVYLRYFAQAKGLPTITTAATTSEALVRADEPMTLDELWALLEANLDGTTLNFVPGALSTGPIADYYKRIAPSGVAIDGAVLDATRDGQNRIVRITVDGTTGAFGMPMTAALDFTAPLKPIVCEGRYVSAEGWELLGMPWIVLDDGGFSLTIVDDVYPVQGAIFATIRSAGITVSLSYPTPTDAWLLTFRTAEPVGMATMFTLAGGVNLLNALPAPVAALGGFGATGVDLSYRPSDNTLESVQVYFGTTQTWTILEGRLAIRGIRVTVAILQPASRDRKTMGQVAGDIVIGSGATRGVIGVSVGVPGVELQGALVEGVITIENLLGIFLPGVPLPLDAVPKITQFLFRYSSSSGDYGVSCNLNVGWTIAIPGIPEIRLDDLSMSIQRARGATSGAIVASFTVGDATDGQPLRIDLSALYQGGTTGWEFAGRQTSGVIKLARLVERFLPAGWSFGEDYGIRDVAFTVAPTPKKYTFFGATDGFWTVPFLPELQIAGDLLLVYSGIPTGTFSGRIHARIVFYFIDLDVYYQFGPKPEWGFTWGLLSGKVVQNAKQEWVGSLSLGTTSIGAMVETMVRWATGSPFNLAAPWDFLNSITFSNLSLEFNFTTKQVSLVFALSINAGFASLTSIRVTYDPTNRSGIGNGSTPPVVVELEGRFFWQVGQETKPQVWDATQPQTTPAPPGNGNKYLDLRLLALGQHVTVEGLTSAKTVQKAIELMATMKDPQPGRLPDVTFDPESAWMIGADFGVLKFGPEGTSS